MFVAEATEEVAELVDSKDSDRLLSSESPQFTHPSTYRTFSKNLAPTFTGLGGVLAILGGLGNWLRAAERARVGEPLRDVAAVMGYRSAVGWIIAGLGLIALFGAITWRMRSFVPKLIPITASVGVAVLTALRLPTLSAEVTRFISNATENPEFAGYHAGLAWGIWLLIMSSIVLLIGSFVGLLREMDLRKGHLE